MRNPCRFTTLIFILTLLVPGSASSREIRGVDIPETLEIQGHTCSLLGVGVRRMFMLDIYLGAVYLEHPTADEEEILKSEQIKHVIMHVLFPMARPFQIRAQSRDGFDLNVSSPSESLKKTFSDYLELFEETLYKGDRVSFTYIPGTGTKVMIKGRECAVYEKREFMMALGKMWLGAKPPSTRFKNDLLGGTKSVSR